MQTVDYSVARANMVEGQVRTNDVTDHALVTAMRSVPREQFVAPEQAVLAYMSESIEVAPGRFLLDPRTFSKLAQLAEITREDTVLDVGGATGYSAAVLAQIAGKVVALESDAGLAERAKANLSAVGAENVTVVTNDLTVGSPEHGPYDVIFLNGAVPARPEKLLEQLVPGGRLVGIVTDRTIGKAHIFVKSAAGLSSRIAFDASVATLPGYAPVATFQF